MIGYLNEFYSEGRLNLQLIKKQQSLILAKKGKFFFSDLYGDLVFVCAYT